MRSCRAFSLRRSLPPTTTHMWRPSTRYARRKPRSGRPIAALPVSPRIVRSGKGRWPPRTRSFCRSEEHTSELQSRRDLVCRLLLEKKSLLAYRSQYGEVSEGGALFPDEREIRDRLSAVARFYGNLVGVEYGEPYVVKEMIRMDDIV